MTEKKYMTASEYFRNEIPLRVKIYMDEFNKSKLVLKELDTHFINKEELKYKIKLLGHKWELKVINNYNIDTPRDLYIVDFTKEILELLKNE